MSISLSSRQTDRQTQWEWVDLLIVQLDLPTVREWFNAINNKQLIFVYNFIRTNQSQLDFPLWIFMNECCVCVCGTECMNIIQYFNKPDRDVKGDSITSLRRILFDYAGLFRFFFFRWHKEVSPLQLPLYSGCSPCDHAPLAARLSPHTTDWRQKCLKEPQRTGRSVNGNWNVSPILLGIIQVGHT